MINAMVRKQDPNNYSNADCWYEVSQLKAFKVDSELFFGIFSWFFVLLLTFIEDTYESQDRDWVNTCIQTKYKKSNHKYPQQRHETDETFTLLQWLRLDLRYLLLIRGNGRLVGQTGRKNTYPPHRHHEGEGGATHIKMEI